MLFARPAEGGLVRDHGDALHGKLTLGLSERDLRRFVLSEGCFAPPKFAGLQGQLLFARGEFSVDINFSGVGADDELGLSIGKFAFAPGEIGGGLGEFGDFEAEAICGGGVKIAF